jgi:hypothetical protein
MVFATSVIRRLAPSEEFYAETETYNSVALHLKGAVDAGAMSEAFDTLLETHPILAGHIEKGPDGRYEIVTDDLLHEGIWVLDNDDSRTPAMQLDQSVALVNVLVQRADGHAEVTMYAHHGLADGYHLFGLIDELFSLYTDVVCNGCASPVSVQPAPEPLEVVLEQRGIRKQQRSGLERLMPAMFAHDLPPQRSTGRSKPAKAVAVPTVKRLLAKSETIALEEFRRTHRLSLNALVSAAILLAEWRLRETPYIPIPYLYPVNLRFRLDPPVTATGATNPVGVATYLAEIDQNTKIVDLARDIAGAFQADVDDGVIQQSMLHFNLQYEGGPPGLPEVVVCTNLGRLPATRTPLNLEVDGWRSQFHRASFAVVDIYSVAIFDDQLFIEHHVHAPAPERSIEVAFSVLRAALEHQD